MGLPFFFDAQRLRAANERLCEMLQTMQIELNRQRGAGEGGSVAY